MPDDTNINPPDSKELWEQLKTVYDPEIPINIVDLGLIYSIDVNKNAHGKYNIIVTMTLTSPVCVMGPTMAQEAHDLLMQNPSVYEVKVDIVWDPPWDKEMISEAGKMQLGLM